MGAAIPLCLSLAFSIREAIPGGEKVVEMDVRTGSIEVQDEIVPLDQVCFGRCSFFTFFLSPFFEFCASNFGSSNLGIFGTLELSIASSTTDTSSRTLRQKLDLIYQIRLKSTLLVTLSITSVVELQKITSIAQRGGGMTRGGKRHGAVRGGGRGGRGGGRGRGRGM